MAQPSKSFGEPSGRVRKAADDKKDASASCALRTAANGAEKEPMPASRMIMCRACVCLVIFDMSVVLSLEDVIVSGDSPVGQTHTWSSRKMLKLLMHRVSCRLVSLEIFSMAP